jgi:chitinase domain-containing protein 1
MVSPVWYNIRRVGPGKYVLTGEHDVDKGWMEEVRGTDSNGETVGRILPRFAVDGWTKEAYEELITSVDAQNEVANVLIEQVK